MKFNPLLPDLSTSGRVRKQIQRLADTLHYVRQGENIITAWPGLGW